MIQPEKMNAQPAAGASTHQAHSTANASASTAHAGAAFRALLERLEKTAKDIDAASEAIDDPRQLGEVVETARISVEEALLAGSDLLEAYRAAQAQGHTDESTTETQKPNNSPNAQASTGHGEAR